MSGYTVKDLPVICDASGNVVGFVNLLGAEQLLGSGVGPSTFAALTDSASVDFATVNGPYATLVAGFAPKASPAFTGTPTAPTQSSSDSSTKLATTAFVATAVAAGGGGGGGGGSSTFAGLTDKATVDIPAVNTPTATALALLAPKASPALTGTPTAPTAASGTATTQIATTAYVRTEFGLLVAGAGSSLDTLNELAAALGNDANFATTMTNLIALRATIASPTFTGTPAAPTASAGTSTTQIATTAFVTTADNLKAPIASPTFTGTPAAPTASAGTSTTQIATTAYVETLGATKSDLGAVGVVALTTKTLAATDIGKLLQEQSTSAHTLSIDTTANSGIAWVAGKFFFLGSVNTGAVTLTALTGVTIVNTGTKTVVQDDTPLVVQMSPTTNRWLVL